MSDRNPWKKLSSKYIHENPWYKIRQDDVIRPDGSPGKYNVIEGRDTALIIPKVGDMFYLTEQFRYVVNQSSIEFPMGGMEENESLEDALQRELLEETGLQSKEWTRIGFFHSSNGFTNIGNQVYLADNCIQSDAGHHDPSEADMKVVKLSLEAIEKYIKDGVIHDGPSIAAFYLFKLQSSSH